MTFQLLDATQRVISMGICVVPLFGAVILFLLQNVSNHVKLLSLSKFYELFCRSHYTRLTYRHKDNIYAGGMSKSDNASKSESFDRTAHIIVWV